MRSRTTPQTAIRAQALAGATWALVLVAGTPTTARADDPPDSPTEIDVDLAIRANDVHQMYCAELYAPDVQRAAEGYQTVGETWGEVDARHEATGEVYWLYWRGLMAECLGQYDQAQGDLHAFLDAHGETPAYAELVKDARRRVTRIQDVNTGDTTRAIGRRRAAIAFLEDPRAEQTLGRIELRRYRNSGLTLDEWTGRRFSLKRRVVFTWAPASGLRLSSPSFASRRASSGATRHSSAARTSASGSHSPQRRPSAMPGSNGSRSVCWASSARLSPSSSMLAQVSVASSPT